MYGIAARTAWLHTFVQGVITVRDAVLHTVLHAISATVLVVSAVVASTGCAGDAPRVSENQRAEAAITLADSVAVDSRQSPTTDAPIGALAASGADVDSAVAAIQSCPRDGHWHVCSVQSRFSLAGLRVLAIDSALGIPGINVETRAWRVGGQQLRLAFFATEEDARRAMDGMDSARAVPRGSTDSPWLQRPTLLHNANVLAVLLGGTDRAIERASNALLAGPPQPSP